jgi:ATP-dependent helicase HrpB
MPPRTPLPIDAVLPEICEQLATSGAMVLQAEPGAGKTTQVPAALLDAGLAAGKSIVVLEPRRVAARSAADFVAGERGEKLGGSVGFQVRFERCGDDDTRLWFVTEGVAVRRLVGDPFLEDVGIVVLDEFHERHLAGDVVLAVARELRRTVRPDLRIVVMSATLEVERVARFLDQCPVVRCPGRVHPVTIEYRGVDGRRLADEVAAAVRAQCAATDDGDVLVFLPGVAEIRRVADALAARGVDRDVEILPLHGELPLEAQRRVLRPASRSDKRRVILSTNVAESSVTVDGVTAVVDSGLARIPEFDAGRGIERLRTLPISTAAADQRAGRAGRQAPGRCLRLWSMSDHAARRQREIPEIRRLDLTTTVLELRAWGLAGAGDVAGFEWLDPPPPGALAAAERLLRNLDAVDGDGRVTRLGEQMLRLPAPPRAARLLLEARRLGDPEGGALLAALLAEREIVAGARAFGESRIVGDGDSDLLRRAAMFEEAAASRFDAASCRRAGVDAAAARAVDRARRQLSARRGGEPRGGRQGAADALLRATFLAYSDRLARRRVAGEARALMAGGGIRLAPESCVRDAELFVAVEVRGGERRQYAEATVAIASAVRREWVDEYFADEIERDRILEFDEAGERVVEVEREIFRGLALHESRRPCPAGAGAGIIRERVLAEPPRVLALSARDAMLLRRVDFAAAHGAATVAGGGEALLRSAIETLCAGVDGFAELRRRAVEGFVGSALSHEQRREVERLAPEVYRLPGGRQARIDYDRVGTPVISARVQELFGLRDSPRIAGGAVTVAVEILGPNHRPVQVTDDLAGFWERTYPQVRKELRGRYPKHRWPEDPGRET